MANIKQFGLVGVGSQIQLGKVGPQIINNAGTFEFKAANGTTDAALTSAGITSSAGNITLTTGNLVLTNTSGVVSIGGSNMMQYGTGGYPQISGAAAVIIPTGATALRPGTGAGGQFRMNSDTPTAIIPEFYNGTAWTTIATGTSGTATNLAGGTTGSVPYQAGASTTNMLGIGTTGYVLTVVAGLPAWSNTPTLTGTNFSSIPNSALVGSGALTLGSTSMALGSTTTTIAGLASVTSTTFVGALTGTASIASSSTIATVSTAAVFYPTFVSAVTGNLPIDVNASLNFNPNTGVLSSTSFTGAGTGLTGTAASLNIGGTAGTVTTNANLTGDVTSVGNATTLGNAPVIAKVLTGYISGSGTVAATDSILQAVQKLNGNISLLVGAVIFQGTWNASTNVPPLTSSTGTKGYLYKVSAAGSTSLDGITQWNIGDSAVFDGTVWDKIDGIATEVISVNSLAGAVPLTGTANRVTVSAANVFDISASYVGQSSLTTLGTITTGTWNGTAIANTNLANSSVTIGSTAIALGASATTLAGLTSVTSTSFVGALTGNATTSTSIAAGAATQIPYQSATSTTAFSSNFTFGGSSPYTLTLGGATGVSLSTDGVNGSITALATNANIILALGASSTGYINVTGTTAAAYASNIAAVATALTNKQYVDTAITAGLPSAAIKAINVTVPLNANGTTNIGGILPIGSIIVSTRVNVTVADTAATLSIGYAGTVAAYMVTTENDPSTIGLYLAESYVTIGSAFQTIATVAATGATTGSSCTVLVMYK